MVARYCVPVGNSIYLKNMVYHVLHFLYRVQWLALEFRLLDPAMSIIICLGKIKLRF